MAITGQVRALLSLLNALQHRVLELLGWSAEINERLMAYLLKPALILSEPSDNHFSSWSS